MTDRTIHTWIDEPLYDITVILPTRGRKQPLMDSLMSLVNLAQDVSKIQILLGFDNDDRECIQWCADNIIPEMTQRGVLCTVFEFNPMGYIKLNQYVNGLAKYAGGHWMMFWNDDAVMQTQDWDKRIIEKNGQFRVLRMKTHNLHPYAIFPIVPREWFILFNYLSPHQISDAWISQVGFLANIVETIDVDVLHDRHDLTGNNHDDTFKNRPMLEGNHTHPADFNHESWRRHRFSDAGKIAWYLHSLGQDVSWFQEVAKGQRDPWARMLSSEFDPNQQTKVFFDSKLNTQSTEKHE